jgi:hypothetical protein
MQIKTGTVKYPASRVFNSEWGERQNVLLTLSDGSEEQIWFKAGQQPHAALQKGQSVQVLFEEHNGKTQRRLIVNESAQPEATTSPLVVQPGMSLEQKQALAAYVEEQAALLGYCLKTSRERFASADAPLVESEESIRALAVSLYIAAQRRFSM